MAGQVLESAIFPMEATGFQITDFDAEIANLVLLIGTALFPEVAAEMEQACQTSSTHGGGGGRHKEVFLCKRAVADERESNMSDFREKDRQLDRPGMRTMGQSVNNPGLSSA